MQRSAASRLICTSPKVSSSQIGPEKRPCSKQNVKVASGIGHVDPENPARSRWLFPMASAAQLDLAITDYQVDGDGAIIQAFE